MNETSDFTRKNGATTWPLATEWISSPLSPEIRQTPLLLANRKFLSRTIIVTLARVEFNFRPEEIETDQRTVSFPIFSVLFLYFSSFGNYNFRKYARETFNRVTLSIFLQTFPVNGLNSNIFRTNRRRPVNPIRARIIARVGFHVGKYNARKIDVFINYRKVVRKIDGPSFGRQSLLATTCFSNKFVKRPFRILRTNKSGTLGNATTMSARF